MPRLGVAGPRHTEFDSRGVRQAVGASGSGQIAYPGDLDSLLRLTARQTRFHVATKQVGQESHARRSAKFWVESLQQVAQTNHSWLFEGHANGLLQDVGVRSVDVGKTDVDVLVCDGFDAERTIGAPYMD